GDEIGRLNAIQQELQGVIKQQAEREAAREAMTFADGMRWALRRSPLCARALALLDRITCKPIGVPPRRPAAKDLRQAESETTDATLTAAHSTLPAVQLREGGRKHCAEKATVLLMTQHAELAPMAHYALDLIDALSEESNVIVWQLVDEGPLLEHFRTASTWYVAASQPGYDAVPPHPSTFP